MTKRDYITYRDLFNDMVPHLRRPDLMIYLDGISKMKKDLINWNEMIVRSCILRLEKKQMISISSENGIVSFTSNTLDKENVQLLMQKITGNKSGTPEQQEVEAIAEAYKKTREEEAKRLKEKADKEKSNTAK